MLGSRNRSRSAVLPVLLIGSLGLSGAGSGGSAGRAGETCQPQDPIRPEKVHPVLVQRAAAAPTPLDSLHVWVWLCDKGLSGPALQRALNGLSLQVSERALERRRRRGRITGLVSADLPVHQPYLDDLTSAGLRLRRTSRWLNAASGVLAAGDLGAVAALECVRGITPLSRTVVRPREGGERDRFDPARPDPVRPAVARSDIQMTGRGGGGRTGAQFDADYYGASWAQCLSLEVPELHELGLTGAGVIIGVLDSGFRFGHEALRDSLVIASYDFVNDDAEVENEPGDPSNAWNHGTRVWGTIAAFNPGTLVGPAFGAEFVLAKTEDEGSETVAEEDNWIAAIEWMEALGVDVTNTSLGYYDWYSWRDMDGDTAPITRAADAAAARGVVVVTSAGNEGGYPEPPDPDTVPVYYYIGAPADGDSVIAVGATIGDAQRVSFSSHGPTFDGRIKPDVMARGVDVASASPLNLSGYDLSLDGTSFSSPLVTGVVALLLEAHPDWNPMKVLDVLRASADRSNNLEPGEPDNDYGWGYVRGARANAWGDIPIPDPGRLEFFTYPNPFSSTTTFVCSVPSAGEGRIFVFTRSGTLVRTLGLEAEDVPRAGVYEVAWDGRNSSGALVASGVYHAVFVFEGLRARTTLLKIR